MDQDSERDLEATMAEVIGSLSKLGTATAFRKVAQPNTFE